MAEGVPTQPYVLIIGAAGIDSKAKIKEPFNKGTHTPGKVRISVGGVARNIADNLARLDVEAVLLSAIGNDGGGQYICHNAGQVGINTDYLIVLAEHPTSAYLALLDENGRVMMSLYDTDILSSITPLVINRRRNLIKGAAMIVIDSNLPQVTISALLKVAQRYNIRVCADPTSTTLAAKLKPYLVNIYMITPNVAEAEILAEQSIQNEDEAVTAARALVNAGVAVAIITLAEAGVVYATARASGHVPAMASEIVDFTGASDALTATVVFGMLNNMPIDEAVRLGASAAALTLTSTDTVYEKLSLELLYDHLLI